MQQYRMIVASDKVDGPAATEMCNAVAAAIAPWEGVIVEEQYTEPRGADAQATQAARLAQWQVDKAAVATLQADRKALEAEKAALVEQKAEAVGAQQSDAKAE